MKIKLILFLLFLSLFLQANGYKSKWIFKKSKHTVTVEMQGIKQISSIFYITQIDELNMVHKYKAYYVQNGVVFFYILMNKEGIQLLFHAAPDSKLTLMEDIIVTRIKNVFSFDECGMKIIVTVSE